MNQMLEIQNIFTDSLSHEEINEQMISALNRQTFSIQDKIVATIDTKDARINLQKIRTKKFVDDLQKNSDIP